MRGLEIRVRAVLRVSPAVVLERHGLERVELPHAPVAPGILIYIVAEHQDQVRPVLGHVAIGGKVSLFVVRAGGKRKPEGFRCGCGRRAGEGAPGGALMTAEPESVEVFAAGLQAIDLGVDGMREMRPRPGIALLHDAREAGVLGDFPGDLKDRLPEIAAIERLGRESGPDHESVGRGIAGCDAELERWRCEPDLRPGAAEGNDCECAGRRGEAMELAAGDPAAHAAPLRCRRRARSRPAAARPAKFANAAERCA